MGICTNKGDCLCVCYLYNQHPYTLENSLPGGRHMGLATNNSKLMIYISKKILKIWIKCYIEVSKAAANRSYPQEHRCCSRCELQCRECGICWEIPATGP